MSLRGPSKTAWLEVVLDNSCVCCPQPQCYCAEINSLLHPLPAFFLQIIVYELTRALKSGMAGVKPLPSVSPDQRLACTPL